jgi:hypothetical protein
VDGDQARGRGIASRRVIHARHDGERALRIEADDIDRSPHEKLGAGRPGRSEDGLDMHVTGIRFRALVSLAYEEAEREDALRPVAMLAVPCSMGASERPRASSSAVAV